MANKLQNMKNNSLHTQPITDTQHEGIAYRYMTKEESAKVADMAKKSFYKPKYRQALKVTTQLDVREYCQTHPDASAKDVLIEIMKTYSPSIPPDILLDMAQVILSEWKTIQSSHNEFVII